MEYRDSLAPYRFALHPDGLHELAVFWPHHDAQRCRLLRISEYRFGRSAEE
jgi:hypothetical protein